MQAARDLDMRRSTVWSMMHRIRGAMKDDGRLLAGLVEMDEAYVGGKPRKRNRRDDDTPSPRGRSTRKTPIIGAVERGGRVKAKMVAHHEMTAADMEAFTRAVVVSSVQLNGTGSGRPQRDCRKARTSPPTSTRLSL